MNYDLPFSLDYVPDWGIKEAVRELLQNVIDAETDDPTNTGIYERVNDTLVLGNQRSTLTPQHLLMGYSSKRDADKFIGRHGEGFKVAILVLLRNGKTVTFFNRAKSEIWDFRIKNSKKYASKIVELSVKKHKYPKKEQHFTMVIGNLSDEDFAEIEQGHIYRKDVPVYETDPNLGRILVAPEYRGKVFVNGLYVMSSAKLRYGYDFRPNKIKLDRDRRLIDSIDLSFLTSEMWVKSGRNKEVANLLFDGAFDTAYVQYFRDQLRFYELTQKHASTLVEEDSAEDTDESFSDEDDVEVSHERLVEKVTEAFKSTYGENALAALSSDNLNILVKSNPGKEVKVVPENQYAYLADEVKARPSPVESLRLRFERWVEGVLDRLSDEEISSFRELLEELPE